ncbi:MAG: hypothetical protein WC716_16635 [Chitinophagaceae bacterium]|jgi:hypothetical protein
MKNRFKLKLSVIPWVLLFVLFSYFICVSYSNTIVLLSVTALICAFIKPRYWILPVLVGVLVVVNYGKQYGFELDAARETIWKLAYAGWTESVKTMLFGHGLGSWKLLVSSSHPHNEVLLLLYEIGIVGLGFGLLTLILNLGFVKTRDWAFYGLLLLGASFLTNSMTFYPEQFLGFGIYWGLANANS